MKCLLIIAAILTSVALSNANAAVLTPEDNKAKQDIVTALSDKVDQKWSKYDMINGSRDSDNGTVIVICNKSAD